MHSFEVHSNESACRKKVRLGLEQVVSTLVVALKIIPSKVLNKHCNTMRRRGLEKIKRSQSYTSTSARFLSTALHSVSQAITRAHTDKILPYNKADKA